MMKSTNMAMQVYTLVWNVKGDAWHKLYFIALVRWCTVLLPMSLNLFEIISKVFYYYRTLHRPLIVTISFNMQMQVNLLIWSFFKMVYIVWNMDGLSALIIYGGEWIEIKSLEEYMSGEGVMI